jgi:1,4-alpha-glucan branching enzyme
MQGYLCLILNAHLPFVRHPEHEKFLEESWLFEAITETYLPLIRLMEGWRRDGIEPRLTLSLSPTLCAMFQDLLLQDRYDRHLHALIELAEKELARTHWEPALHALARMYHERFSQARETYTACGRNLAAAFCKFHQSGTLELITSAATHALLPLLASSPQSLRAQVLVARDHHRSCFGADPRGIWLPECAYVEGIEQVLQEANIRWFVVDTHGLLYARPRPRYGVFTPVFTPQGVAAFGREWESATQVWSRDSGYPSDARYRDFYRDIGFDLDLDYIRPYLPSPEVRGFTGIKYHRITGASPEKSLYDREAALRAAEEHAGHFLSQRISQVNRLASIMERPPLLVAPYDAELFGHWWYEGPEFLDFLVRKVTLDQQIIRLTTPSEYLERYPTQQIVQPSPSTWGEEGYLRMWLDEANQWIYLHLQVAQERMTELARRYPNADGLVARCLRQAARELLLAQASDWPFILRTGTNPEYASRRVKDHLLRFLKLHEQLTSGPIDELWLARVEGVDNLFPNVQYSYWA